MTDKTIVPRKLEIDFGLDIPRHWCHENAFMTHMLNTYTLLVPDNENYYIRHLNACLDEIDDDNLRVALQNFCRQEAQHGIGHRAYWKNLEDLGIRYEGFVKLVGWFNYKLLEPIIPKKIHLANIACIEYINAYIGGFYLERDLLRHADERLRLLFNWHFAEEIEHSGVSFDVFQKLCGNYFIRALGGLLVFPLFYLINTGGTLYLLGQDGQLLKSQTWKQYGRFLFRHGALWHALRCIALYFKPGFHPGKVYDRDLATQFLSRPEFEPYLQEFPSS